MAEKDDEIALLRESLRRAEQSSAELQASLDKAKKQVASLVQIDVAQRAQIQSLINAPPDSNQLAKICANELLDVKRKHGTEAGMRQNSVNWSVMADYKHRYSF